MACVYIAPLKNRQAFKVGKSEDPKTRLLGLMRFYDFDFANVQVVDCGKSRNGAYEMEHSLHCACSGKRVVFQYDGGTEFFSYSLYEQAVEVAKSMAVMRGFSFGRMDLPSEVPKNARISLDELELVMCSLATKLKNKRLGYNMTQQQLADMTGVAVRTVRYMESGSRGVTLANFVKALQALDLDYIFRDLEVETPMRMRASEPWPVRERNGGTKDEGSVVS